MLMPRVIANALIVIVCGFGRISLATPQQDAKAPATTRSADDERAEIRRAMKEMRIWTTAQVMVPLDQCAYGQDDDGRAFIVAASDFSRAEHALVEPFRKQFGEDALAAARLKFPSEAQAEKEMRQMGDPSFRMIDAYVITIHGDEALAKEPDSIWRAVELRRVDGHWKLPFNTIMFQFSNAWTRDKLHEVTAAYAKAARELEQHRRDLAAGKFRSTDDELQARRAIEHQVYPEW